MFIILILLGSFAPAIYNPSGTVYYYNNKQLRHRDKPFPSVLNVCSIFETANGLSGDC